jgi:hypothetical protein
MEDTMKRLIAAAVIAVGAFASVSMAGDYHVGATLQCQDCHVMHGSQAHGYTVGGVVLPIGAEAPYDNLLRDEVNHLCLTCHNDNSVAPDVFGVNAGKYPGTNRMAGALGAEPGHGLVNDAGYDGIDGHTLWSLTTPPGSNGTYVPPADGLECVTCHAQHGSTVTYRNLLNRGIFAGDTLKYAVGTNDLTKDVFESAPRSYSIADVNFNEPDARNSMYGQWCQNCHTDFHGKGGDLNMGSQAGGYTSTGLPWKRHPVADVNLGHTGEPTFVASLARYQGLTNRVKMMSSTAAWNPPGTDLTPSCFSCHKSHGNQNPFGLIFMTGTGTVTEEGDGGIYKDLCRQCHTQGG